MASYNREMYLPETIESILNQSYQDFEFIIVDDGSQESTRALLADYARRDARIRLVLNESNMGHSRSLNKGMKLATGEYIARMDSDDISLPNRFARQVAFMDANPHVGICGSAIQPFGGENTAVQYRLTEDADIKAMLLFHCALAHPATFYRRQVFVATQLEYDPAYDGAEDYELFARALPLTTFANLPEVLLRYRIHEKRISIVHQEMQHDLSNQVRSNLLEKLGIHPTVDEIQFHSKLAKILRYTQGIRREEIRQGDRWLRKLHAANQLAKIYPEPAFSQKLAERWFALCRAGTDLGMATWFSFWNSPFNRPKNLKLADYAAMLLNCALPAFRQSRERRAMKQVRASN